MATRVGATGIRVLLALATLITVGALIQDYRLYSSTRSANSAAAALGDDLRQAEVTSSDLFASQLAYISTSQSTDFWMRRATDLASNLESSMDRLRKTSAVLAARPFYDAAAVALADVLQADKRARTNVHNDLRLAASDIVFAESKEPRERFASALQDIRRAELDASDGRVVTLSRTALAITAAALIFDLAVAIVVAFLGGSVVPQAETSEAATMAKMLRDLPPPVKAMPASASVSSSPTASTTGAGSTAGVGAPALPPAPLTPASPASSITAPAKSNAHASNTESTPLNLPEAAELCVDLARVIDGRDMPRLLERAAKVLDARGVIVWTADGEGTALTPSLAFGYSEKVLGRLGVLKVDEDNATCLAFRSSRPQLVQASAPSSGSAIAVPLITATGCTGVFAAEVRDGRSTAEGLAVAKILAAQFATLIAPAPAAGAPATAAQG